MAEPWLSLSAAARTVGVPRAQLLALIRAHRVPARLVDGRRWFVRADVARRIRRARERT